jgi:hypothetical protein
MMPEFDLKTSEGFRDGLLVDGNMVVIRQRGPRRGDITIRASDITEVRASRSAGDIPFLHGSLNLRVGGKKYVLRRLPKAQRDVAVNVLRKAMATAAK